VPGINGKIRLLDDGDLGIDEAVDFLKVESEVDRAVGLEVFLGEAEEADGGVHAAAVLGVVGAGALFFEMNKSAGELDEAFVEGVVTVLTALEREMLEDIVGLVVFLRVEAGEVAEVAGVVSRAVQAEGGDKGLHAFGFFGWLGGHGEA